MSNDKREPEGISTGGRFAENVKPAGDVNLVASSGFSRNGSATTDDERRLDIDVRTIVEDYFAGDPDSRPVGKISLELVGENYEVEQVLDTEGQVLFAADGIYMSDLSFKTAWRLSKYRDRYSIYEINPVETTPVDELREVDSEIDELRTRRADVVLRGLAETVRGRFAEATAVELFSHEGSPFATNAVFDADGKALWRFADDVAGEGLDDATEFQSALDEWSNLIEDGPHMNHKRVQLPAAPSTTSTAGA